MYIDDFMIDTSSVLKNKMVYYFINQYLFIDQ